MTRKYEKPFALSLGEKVTSAQGYCVNGSIANISGLPNCTSGGRASGGCGNGALGFFTTSCNSGITPGPSCHTGLLGFF